MLDISTITLITVLPVVILISYCICACCCCRRKGKEHREGLFAIPRARNVKPRVKYKRAFAERTCLNCLLRCASCFFHNCCIRFDFKSEISISDAILRYNECLGERELMGKEIFKKLKDEMMLPILLEVLNYRIPYFFLKVLPTGSLREGFGKFKPSTSILATDYDLMLIPDGIAVEEDENRNTNSNTPILFRTVTNTNEIPPGYLWLKLVSNNLEKWNKLCFERLAVDGETVERYLSQLQVYSLIRSNICSQQEIGFFASLSYDATSISVDVKRSGPAINVLVKGLNKRNVKGKEKEELFDADFTFGLYCPKLPKVAQERLDELKDCAWPGLEVINKIQNLGCHVVPKASQHTLTVINEEQAIDSHLKSSSALEFRYSYSQAELLLSDAVPPVFRNCYLAFKGLIKFHINNCPDRDSEKTWGVFHEIPSYVLKTTLFWMLSEVGSSAYKEHDEGQCLLDLIQRLKQYINRKSCPMFWNCEINLLENLSDDNFIFIEQKLQDMALNCESLKHYLLDDWLECERCIRLSCCESLMARDKHSTIIELDKTACSYQKRVQVVYEKNGWFGPMPYDASAMGVY